MRYRVRKRGSAPNNSSDETARVLATVGTLQAGEASEARSEKDNPESGMSRTLKFEDLADRHPMDPHQLRGYANAAKVRLEAHHAPPVDFEVISKGETVNYEIKWAPVDDMLRRSYNNADDAKRDGAYVIAFAAVEELEGLVGIGRAETKTGADYYVAPAGAEASDFENAVRLEVSGTDGTAAEVRARLRQKQEQTRKGTGTEPAIAAVVGFRTRLILVDWA